MGKLTEKVAKGVFWVLLEKFGIQLAHFVVTMVLARLLTPNDYGTVALLSIFISLSNILVDCGFAKALVQKKEATQTDYNSVFYLSMLLAVVLYAILFFSAPLVARFYEMPALKSMLRILALSLVFHSINSVQNAELNRKMLFHLSFRISWICVIVSSATGISFALAGFGPWALVFSSLAGGIAGVIARQMVIKWRPSLSFSWASVGALFSFGWKMTAAGLLTTAYNNLYALLIGKWYTKADLAFVKKGGHIPQIFFSAVDGTLSRVSFPALVKLQDNPERMRKAMRRMITCSTFVALPFLTLLALLACPLIAIVYGERWLPAAPYVAITAFAFAFRPFDTINIQAINARGRSDIFLKLVVLRRIIGLGIMLVFLRQGIIPFMVASAIVYGPLGVVVNSLPNLKYLKYSIAMQFADIFPALVLSAVMGGIVLLVGCIPVDSRILAVVQVPLGLAVYLALSILFKLRAVGEFSALAAQRLCKRMPRVAAFAETVRRRCA